MHKTIHHYFPHLYARLEGLPDPRKGGRYSMCELVVEEFIEHIHAKPYSIRKASTKSTLAALTT